MNTSSRVGRATLIARMRTPSSANRRGTNSSPPTTWKVTASSLMAASRPKRSRSAAIAAASSSLRSVTRSLPTLAFSSSGVPSTTMVPLSMMAMRSQYSASSHVVGGEEHGDRLTPPQLVQVGPDLAAGLLVEPDGGLVQEQHPWGVEQAARDRQASRHPAREGAHLAAAPLTEPDPVQDLVQAGGHGVARDPVQLGVAAQVLLGGEVVVQGGVLEDQADAPPHLGLALDHVEAGHAGAPRARPQQRAQHRDGGRLAGAVGPQEPEGLAGRDAEAHAADGLDLVEPLDQALGLDGGGAVGRGPGRGLPGSPPYSHLTLRCVPAPALRARAGARGSVAAWRPARRGTGRGGRSWPRPVRAGWRCGAAPRPGSRRGVPAACRPAIRRGASPAGPRSGRLRGSRRG